MEKLYSIPEAARALGNISVKTVETWLCRGKLRRTKVGGRTFLTEGELQRFVAASTAAANPQVERAVA